MDELLQEFIAETRDTLEALAGEIVAWETDPADRARLDAIFRFVHTVKGSCGFLDLPRLARLSHAAEDALAEVRSGDRVADVTLVNAVLAVVDRIGELVEAIESGAAIDDSSEEMLLAALAGTPIETAPDPVVTTTASVAAPHGVSPRGVASRTVRLSIDLLDRMMGGVSELVLARNQLARQVRASDDPLLDAMLERLSMTVAELRETVTRTRMQRIEALFSPLPRIVRDAAAAAGRQVELEMVGGDVELDREMIEVLRDPLVHMIRNAIDHGIEDRTDRILSGKPPAGRLRIAARQSGNLIVVEISDDGREIDTDRLVAKIAAADPSRRRALDAMSEEARAELVFEPGLSARDEVTSLSGRGVGMDVVRVNVEQIGGRIRLDNRPGAGLTVTIEVPLTLAILNAVLVDAAGTRFAIPRQAIEEILPFTRTGLAVSQMGEATMVTVRGRRLPLVDIARLLGHAADKRDMEFLALVHIRDGCYAIPLAGIHDMQELVVKPVAPAVMAAGIYAGQMLPDDGAPVLLLDCAGIAARAALTFSAAGGDRTAGHVEEERRGLLFEGLDGAQRLIASDAVERIDLVAAGTVSRSAGRWWVSRDGGAVPLIDSGVPVPTDHGFPALRFEAGDGVLLYPIREAIAIIRFPDELQPAPDAPPPVAGIVVVEGAPVEVIDPLALLDGATAHAGNRPLCLLSGGDAGWMDAFLRPTIEAAGYRVATRLTGGETAQVTLAMEDDAVASDTANVLRLSRKPGGGVYRYDRVALLAALAGSIAR